MMWLISVVGISGGIVWEGRRRDQIEQVGTKNQSNLAEKMGVLGFVFSLCARNELIIVGTECRGARDDLTETPSQHPICT